MSDKPELKPCPMCGGIAGHRVAEDGGNYICCWKCNLATALHYDRCENLLDAWNQRADLVKPSEWISGLIKWELVGETKEDEEEWANFGSRTIGHIDWNKNEMVFFGETYLVADKECFLELFSEWLDSLNSLPPPTREAL